jgi:thiol-disulfide isomerase/thioredoxin
MKRILFIAAVSCGLFTGCNSSNFTMNGTIEGVTEGNARLVALDDTKGWSDTLAVAPVSADGKFTLKGNVEGIRLALVSIDGKNARFPLFLEKGTYTATITATASEGPATFTANIEGGEVQRVFKQFDAIQRETNKEQQQLQVAYFSTTDSVKQDSLRQAFSTLQQRVEERELEVVKANPDSYATAFQVYNGVQGREIETMKEQYNLLGEKAKASKYGKLIAEQIKNMENVAVGQVAPDFKVVTPAGDSLSLYGITAKVKLIDFWASWCGPCRAENPNVVAAYAEYQPKGLEIIGVSLDDSKEPWLKALADDGLGWKHGIDPQGVVAKLYGISSIPHTLLLDANNKIIAKNLRGDALKEKLAELLD